METINPKERRKTIRIPLINEKCIWFDKSSEFEEVEIGDISENGIFIKTEKLPAIGDKVTIEFNLPSELGKLFIQATIVRTIWAVNKKNKNKVFKGFGAQFDYNDNIKAQLVIGAFCKYLRNKQIITVSKRIIEEFFGKHFE